MVPMKWLRLSYLGLLWIVFSAALEINPSKEFSRHTLIKPIIHHGREKREISSTKEAEEGVKHVDFLTITIPLRSKNIILDLRLNSDLIPKNYFRKHQSPEGGYITKYPKPHEIELCHYNGNIRGVQNSWVALSTCNGIRGVIYDGQEMHYIENIPVLNETKLTDPHFLYSHSDLISSNFSCGSSDTPHFVPKDDLTNVKNRRIKRDTSQSQIHGPYNANKLSRYIELLMVIDKREYESFGRDDARVEQHCKDISNIVNSLYEPLNIFIALVGVVIWSQNDEIDLEKNGDKTLTNFLNYRKERLLKDHPNDNAQLLTKMEFSDGVVGKALKGPICTFEFSGGVNVDHSKTIGVVASTIAHEMGHNLGMEHDTPECSCPSEKCIMSPSSSSSSTTTEWSSCSIEYLTVAFEHGMDYCLRNKPEKLFGAPVCGNGFVEAGEQCDCGLKEKCDNPCCNASTCMLFANASCATGECCDLHTCKPHTAGTMCRPAERECDLPEYCTGQSEYCPEDVYKVDGESCSNGMAYCYKGNCRSHSDQCRLLWGPSGQSSDLQCYMQNTKGNRSGNCGYNRLNVSYIKCDTEHVHCGMLQCKHFNEKLEFGMESVAILSHSFISVDSSVVACRTAIVDLGLNVRDPGLTPDGAKCGENKMCLNQKCMDIGSLRTPGACPGNCNGNGVCNSKGHCHCKDGFAPPFCESSGVGGSEDSGPAAYPYHHISLTSIFWYLMLGLASMVVLLFLYSYYVRKSPSYFWKRSQRRTVYVPFLEKFQNCRFCGSFGGIGGGSWSTWVQYRPRWWYKINTRPSKGIDPRSSTRINPPHDASTKHVIVTKTVDIVHTHLPGSNRSEVTVRQVNESNQRSGTPVAVVSPIRAKAPPLKRSISKSDIKPVIINERDLPIANSPHDEENIYDEIGTGECIYEVPSIDVPKPNFEMGIPSRKPVSSSGFERGASIRPNVRPPAAPKNINGSDLNREMAAKLALGTKNAANRVLNSSNVGQNAPGELNSSVPTELKEVPVGGGDVTSTVRKFGGVLKTAPKPELKSVNAISKGSSLVAQKFSGGSEAVTLRANDVNRELNSVARKFGGVLKTSSAEEIEAGDMNKEISSVAQKFGGVLKTAPKPGVKSVDVVSEENSSVVEKFAGGSKATILKVGDLNKDVNHTAPKFGGVLKTSGPKKIEEGNSMIEEISSMAHKLNGGLKNTAPKNIEKSSPGNEENGSAAKKFNGVSESDSQKFGAVLKTAAPNRLRGGNAANQGINSVAKKFGGVSSSTVQKIVKNVDSDEQSSDTKCVNDLKRMFDKK